MSLRAAEPADLEAAARWLGLEAPAPNWERDLALGPAWAAELQGSLVGLAIQRRWGRVAALPLFLVDPERRGRGVAREILGAVHEQALHDDLQVLGLEMDAADFESCAAWLRLGFKLGAPALCLDWPLLLGDAEPELVQPGLGELADLAASLDAALDPTAWVEACRSRGAELVGLRGEDGDWSLIALVREPDEQGRADCPLLLLGEGAPFASLDQLASGLAARGIAALELTAPARQAEATVRLLAAGARITESRPRATLAGFPERSALRRGALLSWR